MKLRHTGRQLLVAGSGVLFTSKVLPEAGRRDSEATGTSQLVVLRKSTNRNLACSSLKFNRDRFIKAQAAAIQ